MLGDVAGRDLLEQALYLDTRMFLPDGILICNDKMSMAASLELRVPFLDVDLALCHDAFANEELEYYELLGFCGEGEGGCGRKCNGKTRNAKRQMFSHGFPR